MSGDTAVLLSLLGALFAVVSFSAKVLALGVIPGNRRPATGVAWLLLIVLSPIIGLVVFGFLGSARVGRRRHREQLEVNRRIAERANALPHSDEELSASIRSVVRLNRELGAFPLVGDNHVLLVEEYDEQIRAMTAAVETATDYVHVEFYIAAWDEVTGPFFDALVAATERGVTVRLLFDHVGSKRIAGYRDFLARLGRTSIEWHPMLPIMPLKGRFRRPDLRNHRKLLVVDGRIGFTGSQNLIEPSYNKPAHQRVGRKWVELIVRLEGRIVAELDAVFSSDWYFETQELLDVRPGPGPAEPVPGAVTGVSAQIVPSGPGFVSENNLRMFTTLLYSATERISLTSPYFVPDESLLYAVTTAAQRGVAVELFVSEQADQFMVGHAQASYYQALLEAGVEIHLYPAPLVLHSKHFTIDDTVAVIGSSNMDMRSFALNYEISLMLLGPEIVAATRRVEDHYRALSRRLTTEEWSRRPARTRYVDNVMRLTSALQ